MNLTLKDLPAEGRPDKIPINASGLKISSCYRRWMLTVVLGLKPKSEDPILTVGKIIHKYAEDLAFNRSPENSMRAMTEALKTARDKHLPAKEATQVKEAVTSLNPQDLPKPLALANCQGAEYKFEFPIDNAPGFVYAGTIDVLSHEERRNLIVITDYKTSRKYLFKDVLAGYEGDTQFTFYPWIVQKHAYEIFKDDINMANLAWYRKLVMRPLAIMLSAKPVTWRIGPETGFTEEHLATFGELVGDFVAVMQRYVEDDILPAPKGMTNNSCPPCPFKKLCFAQNKDQVDLFLSETAVVKYEPLKW
jgi:CRISPR/Cas system-associated exonuclease Cas4 (RecB family)